MPTTLFENQPSAGIGVVEVQKLEFFLRFFLARATLCGDRRGRGTKTRGVSRFCFGPRDPLRGSAWSRCNNSVVFCNFVLLARPSEVQNVVQAGPQELSRGSHACSWDRRVAGSIPPWSAGGLHKLHGATCIEQLAQSNLRRASCTDQFAQSNLRTATCTDQFAQSALPRATCAEQFMRSNLHRAVCTEQLAQDNLQGATWPE